jgi:hypothetical protein
MVQQQKASLNPVRRISIAEDIGSRYLIRPTVKMENTLRNDNGSDLFLLTYELHLPSNTLACGIVDLGELEYVRQMAPKLCREFTEDRSRLVRLWLEEVGQQLSRVMRFHRLICRYNDEFNVHIELSVIRGYLTLKGALVLATILVSIAGAFHARSVVLLAISMFDRFANAVGSTLASLDAAQRAAIRAEWAPTVAVK